jgi:hypothetical protein
VAAGKLRLQNKKYIAAMLTAKTGKFHIIFIQRKRDNSFAAVRIAPTVKVVNYFGNKRVILRRLDKCRAGRAPSS